MSLVSGQAAAAAIPAGGDTYLLLQIDEEEPRSIPASMLPLVFADATDVVTVDERDLDRVATRLNAEWGKDRALRLSLIALDPDCDDDVRTEVVAALNDLLEDAEALTFARNRLFSRPLPSSSDLAAALAAAHEAAATRVENLFHEIEKAQRVIAEIMRTLRIAALEMTGGADVPRFLYALEAANGFASLVLASDRRELDRAMFDLLQNPAIQSVPHHRPLLTALIAPLHDIQAEVRLPRLPADPRRLPDEDREREKAKDFRVAADPLKDRVDREIQEIIRLIAAGNWQLAERYAEQLIERQVSEGTAYYAIRSLGTLASKAKAMHEPLLYLAFAQHAVDLNPDAISYAQLADAHATLGDYERAIEVFKTGLRDGDHSSLVSGLANIYKRVGKFDLALETYDRALQLGGNDKYALNGKGDVLREMGRLSEALAVYDEAIAQYSDSYNLNGRAMVLRDMGRYEEALALLQESQGRFPDDYVNRTAYAEVLKNLDRHEEAIEVLKSVRDQHASVPDTWCALAETYRLMGRMTESIAEYQAAVERFPRYDIAIGGLAEALKDAGRYDDALAVYDRGRELTPDSPIPWTGRGGVLRYAGRYDEALEAYDTVIAKFGYARVPRIAKASLLIAMRRVDEALDLIENSPVAPNSRDYWTFVYLRGIAELRRENFDRADAIFARGVADCPFASKRNIFVTTQGYAALRRRDYGTALRFVSTQRDPTADVVRLHAFGGLHQRQEAEKVYNRLQRVGRAELVSLRDRIASVFMFGSAETTEESLFEQEFEVLSRAA